MGLPINRLFFGDESYDPQMASREAKPGLASREAAIKRKLLEMNG